MEGGLDEQEFAVRIPNSDREVMEGSGDVEQKVDHEPFVFKVVAEAKMAGKMRNWRRNG